MLHTEISVGGFSYTSNKITIFFFILNVLLDKKTNSPFIMQSKLLLGLLHCDAGGRLKVQVLSGHKSSQRGAV